ncbi:alginate export family protein [Chitinophaga varians]|uniref:Alginate export family protein n=1 Tax=Chitinophaga varians TaxID=2202339 RepID=A0A847RQT3_9BACT|nr:alginate export family protein [Chitinophaga varians]NLR63085.1 alginate export family protein [Chitinophaga varians]
MKKWFQGGIPWILPGLLLSQHGYGQFTLGAQLRTRTELRDGQGAPKLQGTSPAFFTSQRTRLMAGLNTYRLKLGLTVQDIRVWGQDASTINRTTTPDNNGFMLHEAWAEVLLTDTVTKDRRLALKIGRQELVYDDSRLLGNLDWLQQGRRHDALLVKYETAVWTAHAGLAFNQNKEYAAGTVYNPVPPGNYPANTNGGGAYKSLEFVYVSRKFRQSNLSFLLLADQFPKFHIDSTVTPAQKKWEASVHNRYTTGLYYTGQYNNLSWTAAAYYQGGTNSSAQDVSGSLLTGYLQYGFNRRVSAGAGADFTSPDFDPLYGTPHKFWGYMDYFYVASAFGNKGLQDYYLRGKWKPGSRFTAGADVHEFFSAAAIAGNGKRLGTEVDITATYTLTSMIAFEAGYSHFWSTPSLALIKQVNNASGNNNWAYVTVNIHPEWLINK